MMDDEISEQTKKSLANAARQAASRALANIIEAILVDKLIVLIGFDDRY